MRKILARVKNFFNEFKIRYLIWQWWRRAKWDAEHGFPYSTFIDLSKAERLANSLRLKFDREMANQIMTISAERNNGLEEAVFRSLAQMCGH